MAAHRPIEFHFSAATDAVPLVEWLESTGELAWVTHASGCSQRNAELQATAVAMLKGTDAEWSESSFNSTLVQQRWQAFSSLAFPSPGEYLLWHKESGHLDATSLQARGHNRIPVPDPFSGWNDGNSGSDADWPSCAGNPGFMHFHFSTGEAPARVVPYSFIAQTHGRYTAAPAPLKRFWLRLRQFAKRQYGSA
jgi:hypothetical protein